MTKAKVEGLRKAAEEARKYARNAADEAGIAEHKYQCAENELYVAEAKKQIRNPRPQRTSCANPAIGE